MTRGTTGPEGCIEVNGVCEPGESVEGCPQDCGVCGDGVVVGSEECDNGENMSPLWTAMKPAEGACTASCTAPGWCGDGVVNGAEGCDKGAENGDDRECTSACQVAVCGDGQVCSDSMCPVKEDCDLGMGNNGDEHACTGVCKAAVCGDGFVCEDPSCGPEVCDNGPGGNVDYSPMQPRNPCNATCTSTVVGYCGDGVINGGEVCDNGPVNRTYWGSEPPADACSAACDKQFEWCGDEMTNGPEECDDGPQNPSMLDGCAPDCQESRVIFVAKTTTTAGKLNGLDGADALCALFAQNAKDGGDPPKPVLKDAMDRTFRAWISTHQDWPAKRFTKKSGGRYVGLDETVIADGWTDLTDGSLDSAVHRGIDWQGVVYEVAANTGVLTHTGADGTSTEMSMTTSPCQGWSVEMGMNMMAATYGYANGLFDKGKWTDATSSKFDFLCTTWVTLYCVED